STPEIAADIARYMQSGSADAKMRVAVMRLAWDFLGSEFGSRHAQYEKFYGGASFLVKQNVNRAFDYKRATAMVDAPLALPPVGCGRRGSRGRVAQPLARHAPRARLRSLRELRRGSSRAEA